MKKYFNQVTIIIITYKSDEIIFDFIKKIPKKIKVIVVENSKNFNLKKKIEKKYKNSIVYLRNNEGVSSSLNFGVKKIKTKYFLHLSPDLALNFNDIKKFVLNFLKKSLISSVSANNFGFHAYYKNIPINFNRKNGFARTQDLKPIQVINYAMMAWHKSCVKYLKNGELFPKNNLIYESSRWSGILLKHSEDLEIVRALYRIAPDQGHKKLFR